MTTPFVSVPCTTLHGIEARVVHVEVSERSRGVGGWAIVGLPDAQIKESKERVIAAFKNCGLEWPKTGFVINLSPAFERKIGTSFDLPIAIGIQCALQDNHALLNQIGKYAIIGELSLNGGIRKVRGALSSALAALEAGYKGIIVPRKNVAETAVVEGIEVYPVETLMQAVAFLSTEIEIPPARPASVDTISRMGNGCDFNEVKGQGLAKRAVEIAAAGNHNVLLIGPPGSGKSMLARRLPTILPRMTVEEALEVTKIHSVAGLLRSGEGIVRDRPFRAPHHSVSYAGLIGGGTNPRPGEITLAHNGILFLDELPEMQRKNLELLRQPLEERIVTITRAQGTVTYPCRFMLVAAMNPCPCGFFHDDNRSCLCTPTQVQRYRDRLSGPLLDRIDMHVDMPSVPFKRLQSGSEEPSSAIASRIESARSVQSRRFKGTLILSNADMGPQELKEHCKMDNASRVLLEQAFTRLSLSARSYHRILKMARTIADLAGQEALQANHIAEAIGFRTLDRHWWDPLGGGAL